MVKFASEVLDVGSNYTTGTGFYAVPEDGYYFVASSFTAKITASTDTNNFIYIYQNNTEMFSNKTIIGNADNIVSKLLSTQGILYCTTGDTISIRVNTDNTTAGLTIMEVEHLLIW